MAYLLGRGLRCVIGADLGVLAGFWRAGRWRTLLVIDGLDQVARLTPAQTLLAELPARALYPMAW
jgi:hypothetical protein